MRRDTHRDRLARDVLLTEEVGRRVAAGHRIERDQSGARIGARARLVEADVSGLADAEQLQVDPADGANACLVVAHTRAATCFARDVTRRDMALGGVEIDEIEEVLLHEAAVAVDANRAPSASTRRD